MKKLLLVTGDLATGKSTFANILSQRYDAAVLYKDSIKEVLGDTVGFANREENLKLSKAAVELMLFLFSESGKQHKDLILEANFHTAELQRLCQIADRYSYDVLTLVLRGDTAILHKRYLHRIQYENRHPVHLSTTLDVFEDFRDYIQHSRNEAVPGKTILVDANDFSYQKDAALLARIDTFMGV